MPKYNDKFTLDIDDVALIEQALRTLWSEEEKKLPPEKVFPIKTTDRIRDIHSLLGKISSQKIYYSEVNRTSCPIG
ncbi:MAG: hypothetical protein QNJ85_14915 [Gammaproteobacteria bacterium]|nr:hypothetical protein [Gammaproteobacteria bacterium]